MDVQFRALMEHSSDAVLLIDAGSGNVVDCNAAALRLLNTPAARILGRHHTALYPPDARAAYGRRFERIVAGTPVNAVETRLLRDDGEPVWTEMSGSVCDANGRTVVLSTFQDKTEQRRAQEENRRLNRILLAINACDEAIMDASSESQLQARITELLVETGVCRIAALVCFHSDGPAIVAQSSRDGLLVQRADVPVLCGALGWPSAGGAAGAGVRIARFAADGPAAPFSWAVTSGECPVSLVSFPIDCAGQESGALLLCSCECGAFEPQELDMLGKVADHLRNGIETIRTRSERDQALEDLRFRLGLEAILSSAIRAFFNLTGQSVDAPVQAAWARISEFLGIDHGYYVLFERDGVPESVYEWHAPAHAGTPREASEIVVAFLSRRCPPELKRGEPLLISADLPESAGRRTEPELCGALEARSVLLVPVQDEGRLAGVQALFSVTQRRSWADEDIAMLKSAGQIILGVVRRARTARVLEENEQRQRLVLDAASNGVIDVDFVTGRVFFGDNWARMLGYERHEIEPTIEACSRMMHPDDVPVVRRAFEEHVSGLSPQYLAEFRLRTRDGDWLWVVSRGKVVEWEEGRPRRFLGTHTDISDRKRIESALQWRDARHRALLEAIPDTLLRVRRDGEVLDVHALDQTPLADMARTTLGQRLFDVFPDGVAELAMHHIHRALDHNQTEVFEFHLDSDGVEGAFEARTVPADESEVMLIIRDVSERSRLEQEILEVSERERARIGQDLHDGLGQQLVGIGFLVNALTSDLERGSSPLAENGRNIAALVAEATEQSRSLARGLHITGLEEDGLARALEELASRTRAVYDAECRFLCRGAIRLPAEEANQLYRIAQEAVTNAIRHARADTIVVSLSQNERRVRLVIEDDGCGFGPTPDRSSGLGLNIMRYRARVVSASLEVDSEPGHGTRIMCSLPLLRRV